jgi:hypothetical protein
MKTLKNKIAAIAIAVLLMLSMTASTILIASTSAHSPPWTIISYAYLTAAPNPVGVGQSVGIYMWVDTVLPGSSASPPTPNDIRRSGYSLTITAPDGTATTQTWATVSDTTGIEYYYYTPTQAGNYTLVFNYPGQIYTWGSTTPGANTAYTGDVYTAESANITLSVQSTPIDSTFINYPLPTEYWTHPIEGRNYDWYTIASNYLSAPYIANAPAARYGAGVVQPYGSAPTSGHIMWTYPIQYGGIVGGNLTTVPGEAYYSGITYNVRFSNPIIIQGTLFFQLPFGETGGGGNYVALDLRTGKTLWSINASATGVSLVPSFGYLPSEDQPNQHGILPNGLLIAITTAYPGLGTVWRGYDPMTGVLTTMNVTNVPSGSAVAGPSGEYLIDTLNNLGNTTNPNWYLTEWNSSRVFGIYTGTTTSGWYTGTENASNPVGAQTCYDWNISLNLPWHAADGAWTIGTAGFTGTPLISQGNMMLLVQGTFGGHVGDLGATITPYPANITAISLKPNTLGQVLWTQSYPQAPNNITRYLTCWDPTNGVFIFNDKETFAHWGYSTTTGNLLWGPSYPPTSISDAWNFQNLAPENTYNGRLYFTGYSGLLYCFNVLTGAIEWTFGNGGDGNSTYVYQSGLPYSYIPMFLGTFANGMVYVTNSEHSPNSPLYQGYLLRCINATTGKQLWAISDFGNPANGASGAICPVASGYLVTDNCYDQQLYCYGRGPSQTTVTAPQASIELGRSLIISGSVTDIAAGTKQNEQTARFPNGVACVSDAIMSSWMEYVYMQKPKPTDATGVLVTISVIDANGNYREIGTTTSNSDGSFSLKWTPDIEGAYTAYATFAGSNAYWPSHASAFFAVDPAAPTPAPTQAIQQQSAADMYLLPGIIGIIIAIVIGFAITILVLRKRP